MRNAWLPLGLVVLVGVAALPLACGPAFEATGSTGTSTGSGGAAASATGSSGGGVSTASAGGGGAAASSTSTGAAMDCTMDKDCKGARTLCGYPMCLNGSCVLHQAQNNGPSFSQLYGDCHLITCDKGQLVSAVNKNDRYDDGNECTADECSETGVASNTIKVGKQCGNNGICSTKGVCVECTGPGNCDLEKPACIGNVCSALTCQSQTQDGNETDEDCGGDACAPCDDGKVCSVHTDCKSKVCLLPSMGAPAKKCLLAVCNDGFKNGKETDVDCGGPECPGITCADGKGCALPSDCASGVCQVGVCIAAKCTDGVKNGTEAGIDCGTNVPGCAKTCPGG